MKINKIRFENFRQFKDAGEIECSSDGKITIVYGKIGTGKTTLHQMCQWILYGKVRFNQTADAEALYNFQYASEVPINHEFEVKAALDFEHMGTQYELIRVAKFRKLKDVEPSSKKIAEDFVLVEKFKNNDWQPSKTRTKELVERMVPEALSNYFFFDGETMISDLKMKSNQSAKALKNALYYILDLELYQNAMHHIKDIGPKKSVIGKLKTQLAETTNDLELKKLYNQIMLSEASINAKEKQIDKNDELREQLSERVKEISQLIGGIKTKSEYEQKRKGLEKSRDKFINNIESNKADFGKAIKQSYTKYLVSKVGLSIENLYDLDIAKQEIPYGLSKNLVLHLLKEDVNKCVCGRDLGIVEKEYISKFEKAFPPDDYGTSYKTFIKTCEIYDNQFDDKNVMKKIEDYLSNLDGADAINQQIKELDEEEKQSPDIENLVSERAAKEQQIIKINKENEKLSNEVGKEKKLLDARNAKYNKDIKNVGQNKAIAARVEIMEEVYKKLQNEIMTKSDGYSKALENNIKDLVDSMLIETVREVSVDKDFSMKVYDNFGSQAKSEGQFAIVSFAYIGGIMKLIQEVEDLKEKEFPLVLDAPFSKLGEENIKNVVNIIPKLAPQVIIFSKDSLEDAIDEDLIGNVYTIESNVDKNISKVVGGNEW